MVPDNVQDVPVIVGQPFLNNDNVTVLVRGHQVRLFNQNNVNITNIDDFLSQKVSLYVEETTVIPPNFVGHITLTKHENVRDVFVDLIIIIIIIIIYYTFSYNIYIIYGLISVSYIVYMTKVPLNLCIF